MTVKLSPEERQNVETEAKRVVAARRKVDAETVNVRSFEWSDEFGNYNIHLMFEKDGRTERAWGHTQTSEFNSRLTHRFILDGGSGPG